MKANRESAEKELYKPIRKVLADEFQRRFGRECYLEVTANGVFSETIKRVVRHDIVFKFLGRSISPDLTGFVPRKSLTLLEPSNIEDFITVEIKREKVTPQDIYQAKMYGDLFQAKYALLISPEPIPEEIRRLQQQLFISNRFMSGWVVYIGQWEVMAGSGFVTMWFPESPFNY